MAHPVLSETNILKAIHEKDRDLTPRFIREVLPTLKGEELYAVVLSKLGVIMLNNKAPHIIIATTKTDSVKEGKFPGAEDETLLREHDLTGDFNDRYRLITGTTGKTAYELLKDFDLKPGEVKIIEVSSY